jgi:endonuclease/exonuclease/phosphatase family metal-dependent hydrolase
MGSPEGTERSITSEEEFLVLTANLQQGHGDPSTSNQMDIFVNRVSTLVPFLPDVLLLQEVSGVSSEKVARLLRRRTHMNYRVIIGPPEDAVISADDREEIVWDSAIVVNMDTTQPLTERGVITTKYDPADGVPGVPARTKQHSYLRVKKSDRLLPIALTSIHFVTSMRLVPRSIGFCYKTQWTREIIKFINERFPSTGHVHVVGGDLNNPRCLGVPETIRCDEWPFWNTLTARAGYSDAIFAVHGSSNRALHRQTRRGNRTAKPRIDYVFTTATVMNSSHDVTYGSKAGQPGFYSDHRFLWAHLRLPPMVASGPAPSNGNAEL